ncbi:MAG: radical SAM protein [Pseudomonadota bacterium]
MFDYEKSRFTVEIPVLLGQKKRIALYHTMTRAYALPPETMWRRIVNKKSTADDSGIITSLLAQGILAKRGTDENAVFKVWFQQYVHDYSHLRFKFMVTRGCNNRCTYCILDPESGTMSHETAQAVDTFCLDRITAHHPAAVTVAYSGGEPLINLDVMVASAGRQFNFCRGKGIDYSFIITTNGTLLTPQTVQRLNTVGLSGIRVSMAGPQDIHDRLRPSSEGKGTYETIMKNLEAISGTVPITIECQFDAGTDDFTRIPEMMDDLVRRNIRVDDIAFTPILAKRGESCFDSGMGDPDQMLFLQQAAVARGLSVNPEAPSNACLADFRSFYVFDTDGVIIPCSSLQGGEMAYGHVERGIDFTAEAQLLDRKLPERCLDRCELLPLCLGGCRLQALTHGGDFNGIDCHYDIYSRLLADWIEKKALAVLAKEAA